MLPDRKASSFLREARGLPSNQLQARMPEKSSTQKEPEPDQATLLAWLLGAARHAATGLQLQARRCDSREA